MKKKYRLLAPYIFPAFLAISLTSCDSSDSGGEGANIKYQAEADGTEETCFRRIKYIDEDGVEKTQTPDENSWSHWFTGTDGDHLYLLVQVDCNQAIASLYIGGDRVKRETSYNEAEIDGYLRIDEQGNATFEESDQ